jgi:hypothetical protein
MATMRATLTAADGGYLDLELNEEEELVLGHAGSDAAQPAAGPDLDLGEILSAQDLKDVGLRHAVVTYRDGRFWIKTLGDHRTWIEQYVVAGDRFFKLTDGDSLKFGQAEVRFQILGQAD